MCIVNIADDVTSWTSLFEAQSYFVAIGANKQQAMIEEKFKMKIKSMRHSINLKNIDDKVRTRECDEKNCWGISDSFHMNERNVWFCDNKEHEKGWIWIEFDSHFNAIVKTMIRVSESNIKSEEERTEPVKGAKFEYCDAISSSLSSFWLNFARLVRRHPLCLPSLNLNEGFTYSSPHPRLVTRNWFAQDVIFVEIPCPNLIWCLKNSSAAFRSSRPENFSPEIFVSEFH